MLGVTMFKIGTAITTVKNVTVAYLEQTTQNKKSDRAAASQKILPFLQHPHFLSLRTAQAKEYSLDKEQTSYDDVLDALRLRLKGYENKLSGIQSNSTIVLS